MKAKILVVDDEESIRYTFHFFLSEDGYAVTGAANYDEAMALIGEINFDLIFVDIVMDGKNGIDLLKKIQEIHPSVPVIIITGAPSIDTAAESVRCGALDYIIKPIRQESLLRSASVALKHKVLLEEKEKCRLNFQAIFRSVKDGIITVDAGMAVVEINKAATQICRVQRDKILSQPVRAMARACHGNCIDALNEVFKTHELVEIRYIECHLDPDRHQVVSANASPLLNEKGEFTGAVMVIRDETRLKEMEHSLKEYRKSSCIIGRSEGIRKVKALIQELSKVPTTVLVTGESGTGKELVVEELHRRSDRSDRNLVKVNCAALSENLLESELFGHVAGAFTGANKNKVGRFQRADGGTLFLDEIGEITQFMQLRLLRVIETMEFERVGDSAPIKVNVRVVAATNQDLKEKVARGEFRADLYYRLMIVNIQLPPLRERQEDIPLLLEHFLCKFNQKFDKKIKSISTDAWKILSNHHWPGNVRELENAMEHAFIKCHEDAVTVDNLPAELRKCGVDPVFGASSHQEDGAEAIRRALRQSLWNKSKAARLLGISRRSIYRKIDKFGIEPEL